MKKLGMLSIIAAGMFLGGCSDDDKEFQLDTNRMTGVDWYYNGGTSGNRLSFTDENVLDINVLIKMAKLGGLIYEDKPIRLPEFGGTRAEPRSPVGMEGWNPRINGRYLNVIPEILS